MATVGPMGTGLWGDRAVCIAVGLLWSSRAATCVGFSHQSRCAFLGFCREEALTCFPACCLMACNSPAATCLPRILQRWAGWDSCWLRLSSVAIELRRPGSGRLCR